VDDRYIWHEMGIHGGPSGTDLARVPGAEPLGSVIGVWTQNLVPTGILVSKRSFPSSLSDQRERRFSGVNMKYCVDCGAALAGNEPKFCAECGFPLPSPPKAGEGGQSSGTSSTTDRETQHGVPQERATSTSTKAPMTLKSGFYPDPYSGGINRLWTGSRWEIRDDDSPIQRAEISAGRTPPPGEQSVATQRRTSSGGAASKGRESSSSPAPGWYPHPYIEGAQRLWLGTHWEADERDTAQEAHSVATGQAPTPRQSSRDSSRRRDAEGERAPSRSGLIAGVVAVALGWLPFVWIVGVYAVIEGIRGIRAVPEHSSTNRRMAIWTLCLGAGALVFWGLLKFAAGYARA